MGVTGTGANIDIQDGEDIVKVGFIGLGNIGQPMAMCVVNSGHQTTVHDIRQEAATDLLEAGAVWAETPAEVARACNVVMGSLPGPLEVEAVVSGEQGVLEGAAAGSVYIDLATNSPSMVRKLHAVCAKRGVEYIDAPVSKGSGSDSADRGVLTVMVGGDVEVLERVRPVLEAIGDPELIYHCGPVGAGATVKLCNNLVAHTTFSVVAEALTIGLKAGVELETLATVLAAGSASSPKLPRYEAVFDRNFEPAGHAFVRSDAKDVRLATELAREVDVPADIAASVDQKYVAAVAAGIGHLGGSAIVQVQEERARVVLGRSGHAGDGVSGR